MKVIKFYVPATIGNVGPGFDVLGLALEGLGNTYTMSLCEAPSRVIAITGVDAERVPQDPTKNLTLIAARNMAEHLGKQAHFALKVHQELPVGGGLGSSAAACLAGAYGAAVLFSPLQLLERGLGGEVLRTAAHLEGHLDNLAPAYYGGLTIASSHGIMKVPQTCPLWLAVVTPQERVETKQAREVLPKELAQADWVAQMALSCSLVCAWQQGDYDGIRMALTDPYAEPRRAHLIPNFYELKQNALENGALGSSISGAGPSVFAVFSDELKAYDFARQHLAHVGQVAKEGIRLC